MTPNERPFSTRKILIALVIFNLIAIGLSEIQRRALIDKTIEGQQELLQLLQSFKVTREKEVRLSAIALYKLDRATDLLTESIPQAERPELTPQSRDGLRAKQITKLKAALEQYRAANSVFPGPFANNSVADLSAQLVGGGYLESIPEDPLPGREYRYTTDGAPDRKRYGLKITLENGGDCLTGVGTENRGWWGTLPKCPF